MMSLRARRKARNIEKVENACLAPTSRKTLPHVLTNLVTLATSAEHGCRHLHGGGRNGGRNNENGAKDEALGRKNEFRAAAELLDDQAFDQRRTEAFTGLLLNFRPATLF